MINLNAGTLDDPSLVVSRWSLLRQCSALGQLAGSGALRANPLGHSLSRSAAFALRNTAMNAYADTYKIEGDKLILYREIDARGAYLGQVRFFKVDGDRLQYKSVPFVSSFDGKEIVATVVWDRVK